MEEKPSLSSVISEDSLASKRPVRSLPVPSRLILNAVKDATESTKNVKPSTDIIENSLERSSKVHKNKEIKDKDQQHFPKKDKLRKAFKRRPKEAPSILPEKNIKITISSDSKKRKVKVGSEEDAMEEEENEIQTTKKTKLIRCTFWPSCEKGESCLYFHPTENCKNFPGCSFGDKCLYIHPSVLCKFGNACMRLDCAFSHPNALKSSITQKARVVPSIPCKFGLACSIPNCVFKHPSISCRFGIKCMKGKFCNFSHSTICKFGMKCSRPGCIFAHQITQVGIPCKFGDKCANEACTFEHPSGATNESNMEIEIKKLSDTLPSTPPVAVV